MRPTCLATTSASNPSRGKIVPEPRRRHVPAPGPEGLSRTAAILHPRLFSAPSRLSQSYARGQARIVSVDRPGYGCPSPKMITDVSWCSRSSPSRRSISAKASSTWAVRSASAGAAPSLPSDSAASSGGRVDRQPRPRQLLAIHDSHRPQQGSAPSRTNDPVGRISPQTS